ncbi:MAG: tetratricopeptide repeat protein, partial [Elusimicrobiota bacterium]
MPTLSRKSPRARLAAALLFLAAAPVGADFDAAQRAEETGNYAAALQEFRALADQGHAEAQFRLGSMLEAGRGTPKDEAGAVVWHGKAAAQGNRQAQYALGQMHRQGRGVRRDASQALKLLRASADQGYPAAAFALGEMNFRGDGAPQNYEEAARWFRKAMEGPEGDITARHYLALMHARGLGVPRDAVKAFQLWRRAADEGSAWAQGNLGLAYADGRGAPRDLASAYFWLTLAANEDFGYYWNYTDPSLPPAIGYKRDEIAAKMERIEQRLTPAQTEKIQRDVAEWKPTFAPVVEAVPVPPPAAVPAPPVPPPAAPPAPAAPPPAKESTPAGSTLLSEAAAGDPQAQYRVCRNYFKD